MKYGFRSLINDLHLWLGIGSGIIIFLICLSGSFLVFEKEIQDLFTEKVELHGTEKPLKSLSELSHSISSEVLGKLRSITIPKEAYKFYEVRIKTSAENRRGTSFLLNPYTAEVIELPPSSAEGFMSAMQRLHRWLLLDSSIGRPIVGVATVIFLMLSLSGLILWFPKKWIWKNFRSGFKIKTRANWKRINHDLHNSLGFYSLLPIFIMALTGLCWSFQGYREVAGDILGSEIFRPGREGTIIADYSGKPAALDEIYGIAQREFPFQGDVEIQLPTRGKPMYSIRKSGPSSFTPAMADQLFLDSTGKILLKEIFSKKPLNEQIALLIKPIHTGHVFGIFSKTIYLLACLVATSLPVTGTIIWINKLRKKSKRRHDQKRNLARAA